jgi:hypothetical protein
VGIIGNAAAAPALPDWAFWSKFVLGWVPVLLALVVFWAAGRDRMWPLVVAPSAVLIGLNVYDAAVVSSRGGFGVGTVLAQVVGMIWPVGALGLLLASYLGDPLGRDGAASPWWRYVAAVVWLPIAVCQVADMVLFVPEASTLIPVLVAGLLYAWMRLDNPLHGAVSWLPVTLLLALLTLPSYVLCAIQGTGSDALDDHIGRQYQFAAFLALLLTAALAAAHLRAARRAAAGGPAGAPL